MSRNESPDFDPTTSLDGLDANAPAPGREEIIIQRAAHVPEGVIPQPIDPDLQAAIAQMDTDGIMDYGREAAA